MLEERAMVGVDGTKHVDAGNDDRKHLSVLCSGSRVPLDLSLQACINDPGVLKPRRAEGHEVIRKNAGLRCACLILIRTDDAEGRKRVGQVPDLQISGLVSVQREERTMVHSLNASVSIRVECENDQISGF